MLLINLWSSRRYTLGPGRIRLSNCDESEECKHNHRRSIATHNPFPKVINPKDYNEKQEVIHGKNQACYRTCSKLRVTDILERQCILWFKQDSWILKTRILVQEQPPTSSLPFRKSFDLCFFSTVHNRAQSWCSNNRNIWDRARYLTTKQDRRNGLCFQNHKS